MAQGMQPVDMQWAGTDIAPMGDVFSDPNVAAESQITPQTYQDANGLPPGGSAELLRQRLAALSRQPHMAPMAQMDDPNLQALQAIVMPRPEVFVNHNERKFDAEGNLTDAETGKHLANWLTSFIEWVEKKP